MQINKAINDTIESALVDTEFNGVPLKDEDTTEIVRPSLKVKLEDSKGGKFNSCNKERTLTVRVYFFAKDRYKCKKDNLKMREIIENAFLEDLKVTDTFYMPITSEDGVTSDVVDTVLECSFDLYSIEEIVDNTPYENMEELNLKFEVDTKG